MVMTQGPVAGVHRLGAIDPPQHPECSKSVPPGRAAGRLHVEPDSAGVLLLDWPPAVPVAPAEKCVECVLEPFVPGRIG